MSASPAISSQSEVIQLKLCFKMCAMAAANITQVLDNLHLHCSTCFILCNFTFGLATLCYGRGKQKFIDAKQEVFSL